MQHSLLLRKNFPQIVLFLTKMMLTMINVTFMQFAFVGNDILPQKPTMKFKGKRFQMYIYNMYIYSVKKGNKENN